MRGDGEGGVVDGLVTLLPPVWVYVTFTRKLKEGSGEKGEEEGKCYVRIHRPNLVTQLSSESHRADRV